MPRSQIKIHPQRHLIEAHLAARAPLHVIAAKFGVSRDSAFRHRVWMREKDRPNWRALRAALRERGLTRRSTLFQLHTTPENPK